MLTETPIVRVSFDCARAISLELRRLRFSSFQYTTLSKSEAKPPVGASPAKACAFFKVSSTDGPTFVVIVKRSPVLAIYLWEFRRVKREIVRPECGQTPNLAFTPDRVNDLPEIFSGYGGGQGAGQEKACRRGRTIIPSQSLYNTLIPKGRVNGNKKFRANFEQSRQPFR